jgi:hypothetical protein
LNTRLSHAAGVARTLELPGSNQARDDFPNPTRAHAALSGKRFYAREGFLTVRVAMVPDHQKNQERRALVPGFLGDPGCGLPAHWT